MPGLSSARRWVSAVRPATLCVGAIPVAVGTALAAASDEARPLLALAALVGALAIQIGTNLVNDAADFERGADGADRLGPPRATQQGWLTARAVKRAAWVSFALAFGAGLLLVQAAGWPILVLGLVSIACGFAYTTGPWPLAYVGLGDLFVLAFFGLVATCGTYYVQTGRVTGESALAGAALGLLATAVLVVNNLRDRESDARAGKRTLAVRLGPRFARAEYALCVLAAYALLPLAFLGDGGPGWLLPLLSLPLAVAAVRRLTRLDGRALNPELGATARLELLFGALLAVGVLL